MGGATGYVSENFSSVMLLDTIANIPLGYES